MTIYVQSCGKSQNHDYVWLKVEEELQEAEIPRALQVIKPEELIDSQNPSIILARSGEHLLLIATALDTRDGRTDFMGRQIRNSVAWVEDDSPGSQRLLRKLVIRALKGKLDDDVDQAVHNAANSRYGFRVDFQEFQKIEREVSNEEIGDAKSEPCPLKVGKDRKPLRNDVIEDLKKYQLPESIQILVVVTTMKSAEGLKAKDVWRGLSSRIGSKEREDQEDWEDYLLKKNTKTQQNLEVAQKSPIIGILILLIIGVVILAILIPILAPQNLQPKEQQTSVQPSVTTKLPSETFSRVPQK